MDWLEDFDFHLLIEDCPGELCLPISAFPGVEFLLADFLEVDTPVVDFLDVDTPVVDILGVDIPVVDILGVDIPDGCFPQTGTLGVEGILEADNLGVEGNFEVDTLEVEVDQTVAERQLYHLLVIHHSIPCNC